MASRPVLVLTRLEDPTADVVIGELNRRGVPVVRLDSADLLNGGVQLEVYHGTGRGPGRLATPSRELELAAVQSVYLRRPTKYAAPAGLDDQDAAFTVAQARHGLEGTLAGLGCRFVNPLWAVTAEYKPAQMAVAAAAGFTTPATLITNRLDAARSFAVAHGPIVYKPLRTTPFRGRDGNAVTIWVRPVDPAELDESIAVAPHIFQHRVAKVADVRTTVIGRRIFSVRIDSPHLDWRENYDDLRYVLVDTPPTVAAACHAYLDRFGLLFGAFDFGIGADTGCWYFYECNPNGQWRWLEDETGSPMTAAIADLLENL